MGKRTGLYERHIAAGAQIVDFGGCDMPLHYGSQIEEHHAVRRSAGVFDVSHMTVIDVSGRDSHAWLRLVLANDIDRLKQLGKGLYSCLLNQSGGVIDDLIVYWLGGQDFRLVVNAATRDYDLEWLHSTIGDGPREVRLNERADLGMLAVQGPAARELAAPLLGCGADAIALAPFNAMLQDQIFVARTGYTGEDGWEVVLPVDAALKLWDGLLAAGAQPCGLGARDTLRLEAGLNLYGQDMTQQTSPLESNLGWTVAWEPAEREFVGREALEKQRAAGVEAELVGLLLEGRGVMRAGHVVTTAAGEGVVTSGSFSPTLERSIALARVPAGASGQCTVQIRSRTLPARIVRPPFVRNGTIKVTL